MNKGLYLVALLGLLVGLGLCAEFKRLEFDEIMKGVSQRKRFVVYFTKSEM